MTGGGGAGRSGRAWLMTLHRHEVARSCVSRKNLLAPKGQGRAPSGRWRLRRGSCPTRSRGSRTTRRPPRLARRQARAAHRPRGRGAGLPHRCPRPHRPGRRDPHRRDRVAERARTSSPRCAERRAVRTCTFRQPLLSSPLSRVHLLRASNHDPRGRGAGGVRSAGKRRRLGLHRRPTHARRTASRPSKIPASGLGADIAA